MYSIRVTRKPEKENNVYRFYVGVFEEGILSKDFIVTVSEDYWSELTGEKMTTNDLMLRSMEFLLKKESKVEILKEFDLNILKTHFPDFEESIKKEIEEREA